MKRSGVNVAINSTLGAGFLLSLAAFFYGKDSRNQQLVDGAVPFLWIFGVIWGIFVLLSIFRNLR